jgi:hypothetical protein
MGDEFLQSPRVQNKPAIIEGQVIHHEQDDARPLQQWKTGTGITPWV